MTMLDIAFDFRTDTPPGKDPDARSPMLRRYHKRLWSKHLPSGALFELDDTRPNAYLHHQSTLGEFFLASDSVIPTFTREARISHVLGQIPLHVQQEFLHIGYTIGGMVVFPGNRVGRKMTINGARGFHPRIKDRFDLTVECVRRHYRNENNPLAEPLARYRDFFALFGDFKGYVDYFLLQDLVTDDCSSIRFFMPFDNFTTSPLPESVEVYEEYRSLAIAFIEARGKRMLESWTNMAKGSQ
jgi:hypothetical protein